MEELDLKLKLFGGKPLFADNYGDIEPLKVGKIIEIGYSNYIKYLNLLCLDKKEFFKGMEEKDWKDINLLELFIYSGGEDLKKELEDSFSLFLHGDSYIDEDELCVYVKKSDSDIRIVNKDNFDNIVEVLKWHNYINNFKEVDIKEVQMDEKAKQLKEKLTVLQKKVNDIKRKRNEVDESDKIDFYDILESLSSKSYSINEINIMDLTIYQVYRKFKRIDILDRYDIDVKSMLAGAKDVKLKHWSSKID